RRRHTRFSRDWSSDVCSSDLIGSALLFASLAEQPGASEGGGNPLTVAIAQFGLLREDPQLVRFIAVRCLLLATTLAPPFLLAMRSEERRVGKECRPRWRTV